MAGVTMLVNVQLPLLMNYVKVGGESWDIADIPDEKIREMARAWGEALVMHAQKRRATSEPRA